MLSQGLATRKARAKLKRDKHSLETPLSSFSPSDTRLRAGPDVWHAGAVYGESKHSLRYVKSSFLSVINGQTLLCFLFAQVFHFGGPFPIRSLILVPTTTATMFTFRGFGSKAAILSTLLISSRSHEQTTRTDTADDDSKQVFTHQHMRRTLLFPQAHISPMLVRTMSQSQSMYPKEQTRKICTSTLKHQLRAAHG